MGLRDIYLNAIDSVVSGTLEKEELWDIFEDNIDIYKKDAERMSNKLYSVESKYKDLLKKINKAHEEHVRFTKNQ